MGDSRHTYWLCLEFSNIIEDCELKEIGFVSYPFTRERKFEDVHVVEEKLDRGFAYPY